MRIKLLIPLALASLCVFAQNPRKEIRKGNTAFSDSAYSDAEARYRTALAADQTAFDAAFNLADAIYKQDKFEAATPLFKSLTETAENKEQKAMAYHNLGNALLKQQKVTESIDAYKNALKNNPSDIGSKHNLAFAQRLQQQEEEKEEQEQQEENQQEEEGKEEEKENPQNQKEEKEEQEQPEKQQNPDQISKEEAEKMLEALAQQEKKVQEELQKKKKGVKINIEKDW